MPISCDLLTVYAHADKAHARDRELWRDFMGFLVPLLFEVEAASVERAIEHAVCRSPEEVLAHLDEPQTHMEVLRAVSVDLAYALHLPPEFGVAAFAECNVPTRVHLLKIGQGKSTDQAIINKWLKRFSKIQQDNEFAERMSEWKRLWDALSEDSEFDDEDSLESEYEQDEDADEENDAAYAEEDDGLVRSA